MRTKVLIFIFLIVTIVSYGQQNFDTLSCGENDYNLKYKTPSIKKALINAGRYVQSIVGSDTYNNHIKLQYCRSYQEEFDVYNTKLKHPALLGKDTVYNLSYIVLDKKDTIGYFQISLNKRAEVVNSGSIFQNSSPALIRGFKKYFDNDFRMSFVKAKEMALSRGIKQSPILECDTEPSFTEDSNGNSFVKVKYIWAIYNLAPHVWGLQAIVLINAASGEIEKEHYYPDGDFGNGPVSAQH